MVFWFPHFSLKHFTLTALCGVPMLEYFIFQVLRLSDFHHAIPSRILNRFELISFKYLIGLFCGSNKCSIHTRNYKIPAYNNLLRVVMEQAFAIRESFVCLGMVNTGR